MAFTPELLGRQFMIGYFWTCFFDELCKNDILHLKNHEDWKKSLKDFKLILWWLKNACGYPY